MIRGACLLLGVGVGVGVGLSVGAAHAQSSPKPPAASPAIAPPSAPDSWLPRSAAELQVLDTVNAHATSVTLRVGQSADNASLSIVLRSCMVRPPDLAQDAAAFLDIADSRPGAPGFHGWMFANEPAVSMLEHPIYSVRLAGCR